MRNIRTATEQDAAICAEIYAPFVLNTCISFETAAPTPDEIAQRMKTAHFWLVAENDRGQTVGYAYAVRHRERAAYALSVDVSAYISPSHSRQGYGKALYGELLQTLKSKGFHAAFAGIALPNEASVGLHEAMGFSPVGVYREVGWKADGWRDVGWWQRLL